MKRIFAYLLGVTAFLSLSTTPTFAQGWSVNDVNSFGNAITETEADGNINKERYDLESQVNAQATLVCEIIGCSDWPESAFYYNKSAIAGIDKYIALMYQNPPADTRLWLADTGKSLGFLPNTAYAQGIGFSGLSPILPIWKGFRNIAYVLTSLFMIIVGFMVMLRKKIDPKTVVTVQSALPRIVMTLILITFSYAIVGLLIDLMYLVMIFIINLLVSASGGILGADTASKYLGGGFWTLFGSIVWGGASAFDDIIKIMSGGGYGLGSTVKQLAFTVFPGVLLAIILAVAVLFGFIRILFMLVTSYIQIIIAVLVGPLQILMDAFPGGTGFASWIKNLVSNLSVFPVTAGMMLVGTILTRFDPAFPSIQGGGSGLLWNPPLLARGGGGSGIAGLIGLGVILTIPSVVGSIKEALKAKAPVAAGPGAILGPMGAGFGQVLQLGYQAGIAKSTLFGAGHGDKRDAPGTTALDRAQAGQKMGMGGR